MLTLPGLGWPIHAYGLLLAVGLLLAWVVTLTLGRQDRIPPGRLGAGFVLAVGSGLLAARMAWMLQQPGRAEGVEFLRLDADQLAPFAGVMVAALVGGLYVMRRRIPVMAFYDVMAPGLLAGLMVERLGALLAGVGYGDYAPGLPWAIRFPLGSPPYLDHQRSLATLLPAGSEHSLPVHPTQLYALAIFGGALALTLAVRRRRRFSGQVFLVAGIAVLLGRSLIEEWFRADAVPGTLGPFNPGQVGALTIAAAMGVVLWSRARLARVRPGEFTPWARGGGRATGGGTPAASGPSAGSAGSGPSKGKGGSSKGKGKGKKGRAKKARGKGRNKKRR